MRLFLCAALAALLVGSVFSAHARTHDGSDTGDYLEAISKLKDLPIEAQLDGWKKFLQDHPDTIYRAEIETNIKNLEDLVSNTDPNQVKEKRDTERYLRAVDFSQKLSLSDQMAMWEQFLQENPKSIYRREAKKRLDDLRSKAHPSAKPLSETAPSSPQNIPVVPNLEYKDPQKATLWAIFPGLLVPGIAHWYTGDYVFAGVLTGLRIAGLAVGIPGVLRNETKLIWAGAILVGFSYFVDVVDAPFTVQRYNEDLERRKGIASLRLTPGLPDSPFGLQARINF